MELPPRARRILEHCGNGFHIIGTTSACAENTMTGGRSSTRRWNYLRVRGEYCEIVILTLVTLGTTSACAENTPVHAASPSLEGNYLRVRGEYRTLKTAWDEVMELPPRARRIHILYRRIFWPYGTTSACAENTVLIIPRQNGKRNYLRVRGEYKLVVVIYPTS